MATTDIEYRTDDIFKTSTGVGHHYRPGYYFPSSNFKTVIREPLPPELCQGDEVKPEEIFTTTTGRCYDFKPSGCPGPFSNRDPQYNKAPGHWKVNYVKSLTEQLGSGAWRRPLTMGNQSSETHDRFRAEPGLNFDQEFVPQPRTVQGFLLDNHHQDGPSKKLTPNTQNEKLRGRTIYPKNKGVMDLNDMYLTTNNKTHRRFTPKEHAGYARKNVPTYWECEEYPKAWGFGLKHNPLPKSSVPLPHPPMRDEMVFRSETQPLRRVPRTAIPVPHSGMKPEYAGRYQFPSDVKQRERDFCPVDTPFTLPAPCAKSAYAAPGMYRTEYKTIGSREKVLV